MNNSDAFKAGYDAYWDGLQREDNPHDSQEDPKEYASWLEGWHKARQDDYDESEG